MGLKIKIGNPIKSVSNAVNSAVKSVTSTVERSDIGKAVKVAVQPVSTVNEIRKDVFRGKFESAGNRSLGLAASNLNIPTKILDMSSTLKSAASRDNFFSSWSQGADAFSKLHSGQSLTADESSAVAGMYTKQAAIAATVYGGAVYGQSALAWAGKNAAVSTLVGTQLIKGSRSGNYTEAIGTIGDSISPGLGDVTTGLLTPRRPTVGTGTAPGFADSSSFAPEASNKTIFYAVGGVLLILILAIFKKMRS